VKADKRKRECNRGRNPGSYFGIIVTLATEFAALLTTPLAIMIAIVATSTTKATIISISIEVWPLRALSTAAYPLRA
jgi:hypothetical protein